VSAETPAIAGRPAESAPAPTAVAGRAVRYGRSFAIGSAFAVGWTPCIGPILGAILTLAASSATLFKGAFLLAAWSAGLGLPFLVAGFALGSVMAALRRLRPFMPVLEIVGGALVILVGVLIFLDRFTIFNTYFTGGVNTVTTAEDAISAISITGPIGFVAAFFAGTVAFLSPCCLPLVPAYIGHLAGVSAESKSLDLDRWLTFRHAVAFVLGFTAVFVLLGASVGALGYVVRDNLAVIEKVAGVLLIVLGLNLMGVIRLPWLQRTYQLELGSGGGAQS
jgi:cytochrome c biogenesis protein CcdA